MPEAVSVPDAIGDLERYNLYMPKQHRTHEELMRSILDRIREDTQRMTDDDLSEDVLPTAASIARELGEKLDIVKKKLTVMRDDDLVCPLGMNPKRYRLNAWVLQAIEGDPDHPLYYLVNTDLGGDEEEDAWRRRNAWRFED